MKIALDYDKTFNLDPQFWSTFERLAYHYGHEVKIVTARSPVDDPLSKDRVHDIPVIYCDGIAKRFFCHWFADRTGGVNNRSWDPDVWIDDKPEGVGANSNATKEVLEKWRASEEYLA